MPASTVPENLTESLHQLRTQLGQVIRGRPEAIERVLVCLLAGGHALLEDLPGTGKTTLAYTIARSLAVTFRRIQFTSDLLPADVLGVSIYDEHQRDFVFRPGPVFTNVLLADEINRAMPKTQSSLLEVMDRGKVSMDGETHPVAPPFFVIATQNPVDYDSTFPLPASQLDRFLMRFSLGFPDLESEREILDSPHQRYDDLDLSPLADAGRVRAWQEGVSGIFLEETVLEYLLRLGRATRERKNLTNGASTRAMLAWKRAAQATALLQGREFVTPEDVVATLHPVLAHRLTPSGHTLLVEDAQARVKAELEAILDEIPPPA